MPVAYGFQDAHEAMVRVLWRITAQMEREERQERSRIRADLRRERADLAERRRQHYHGDREQRRLVREETRALLRREAANDAEPPRPRSRRKPAPREP